MTRDEMRTRLLSAAPDWFGGTHPVANGVLSGFATTAAFIYSLYLYAQKQTRINTATGGWLDLIAGDFFGNTLRRKANERDANYRSRILVNIFRPLSTRRALSDALVQLTGRSPIIVEPQRPHDTGAYSQARVGYGSGGAYGSLMLPYQAFVVAYRPSGSGIPYVNGYGEPAGGYGVASRAEYAQLSDVIGYVDDSDIYNAVDRVKPAATTLWTRIES